MSFPYLSNYEGLPSRAGGSPGCTSQRLKNPEDLNALSAQLTKLTVEAALKAEMNHHLGYDKNAPEGHHSGNSRNGYSVKTLKR